MCIHWWKATRTQDTHLSDLKDEHRTPGVRGQGGIPDSGAIMCEGLGIGVIVATGRIRNEMQNIIMAGN